jgi:hypothetical protein
MVVRRGSKEGRGTTKVCLEMNRTEEEGEEEARRRRW